MTDPFRLDGKIAVVTGARRGIGAETVRVLREAGAVVEGWDQHQPSERTVDVTDRAQVEAAVADVLSRHGRIDVLVNNAGIVRDAQLVKVKDGELVGRMSEDDFDAVVAVNLRGVFICTQAVAPVMIAQRYGRVINASSVVGLYGNFGQTNYAATKAGVIGMTKVWARELGPKGITVNALAAGFIGTEMVRSMPERVLAGMIDHTPAKRLGEPRDVAYATLFLASAEAAYVNGAVLSVDGGLVLGT